MTKEPQSPQQYDPYYEDDEIDLLDLLLVLVRHRGFIFKTTTLFIVLSIAYALLATPIYRAETKVLPPQGSSSSAMAAMASMGVPDFASGMLGIKTPGDTLVAITKSNPVLDSVINENGLMTRETPSSPVKEFISENIKKATAYIKTQILKQPEETEEEGPTKGDIRRALADATTAAADTKSGIITISVSDTSPDMAARIANSFVENMQDVMQGFALSDASQQRLFIEKQLKEVQLNLIESESNLSDYQKKTGLFNVTAQASSVVRSATSLRAQITAKEVQLQAAQKFATKNNPKIKQIQVSLQSLKKQLRLLESRSGSTAPSDIALKDLPDAGRKYLRLMRDLKFNEALYSMIMKQYESARMAEAKEPSIIQVISPAEPPEKRDKPKRKLIVVLATVLGFFISVFGAFIKEFAANAAQDPERAEKMKELKAGLKLFGK